MTRHPTPSEQAAYYSAKAEVHLRIANSPGYIKNPEARMAELRQAALYSELAAQATVGDQAHASTRKTGT